MLHAPVRPTWLCGACAAAWPCPHRRDELIHESDGDRTGLTMLMSDYLMDALADSTVPPLQLYIQLIGWIVPRGLNEAGRTGMTAHDTGP